MTQTVKKLAPEILSIIKSSRNILLHCHPSPDPDSVGSALAMKFALESLGKKVTVIQGDSNIPESFSHFPGAADIVQKSLSEIDLSQFDLFIIQDSGSPEMTSRRPIIFPPTLKTIVIDHHISNTKFAREANLVDATYPSTTLILYDLFKEWKIVITPNIATNLFIGAYTDTGGFKYESTTVDTLVAAAELARIAPNFPEIISKMENNLRPQELAFQALALSNIETFLDGHLAIASVSYAELEAKGINKEGDTRSSWIANLLKSVVGWDVGVCCTEMEPRKVKVNFRTRDPQKYDLSVIATKVGGGGHKSAAGAVMDGTLADVKKKIVEAVGAVI